jgi:hypothetical protein
MIEHHVHLNALGIEPRFTPDNLAKNPSVRQSLVAHESRVSASLVSRTYATEPSSRWRTLAYRGRRRLIELLDLQGPSWCTVPTFDAEAGDVLAECARLNLEGLVAKRVDSRYEPGKRSAHRRKLKCKHWRETTRPRATSAEALVTRSLRCCGSLQ